MLDMISIRALLSYARAPLTWHLKAVTLSSLLTVAIVAYVFLGQHDSYVVVGGVAMILASLTLFLVAWGLAGGLFAVLEPNVRTYAQIAANLSARLPQHVLARPDAR
jgi:hypothetical protein